MDNQLFLIDATQGLTNEDADKLIPLKELLNKGYEIKRSYTTNNVMLIHIVEPEPEEEEVDEQVVESVIEVSLTDDPTTVKAYTDDGWVVRDYYSKRVQLIKYRATPEAEEMP